MTNPSPDTGAGTPLTADEERRAIAADRTWASGYAAGRAAAARPATDPAGLDAAIEKAIALGCIRMFSGAARRCDEYDDGRELCGICALRLARLSVADGPGPEERPDWRGHLNAIRRLLVGSPPNADMIDAVIGYALNDCEAAIDAALEGPEERP